LWVTFVAWVIRDVVIAWLSKKWAATPETAADSGTAFCSP